LPVRDANKSGDLEGIDDEETDNKIDKKDSSPEEETPC
jgi:hypothetical protein